MRITFLLSSLSLAGGVRSVVEYANRLSARGHTLTLVMPGGTIDPHMAEEVAPGVTLRPSAVTLEKRGSLLRQARLAWSLARSVPPSDVVIATHTPTTVASFLAAHVLRRGIPVWFFQDYAAMFAQRPLEGWLLRHALRWHDRALTISEQGVNELTALGYDRVQLAGIGLSRLALLRPVPITARPPHTPRRILFVGDDRPRKGMQDFLAAAAQVYAQLPDIRLTIVTKTPSPLTSPVPHDHLVYPDEATLAHLFATSDLLVSASWAEGLGMPPLEAMATATPVVMTDTIGGREYARHEENCLFVPPRHPDALAAAMLRVLQDRALAERLSTNGPPTIARYDWERVTDVFEAALLDIIAQRRDAQERRA